MKVVENTFKKKLLSENPVIGLWSCITDSQSAEIIACAGYDWVVLEAEHSPNTLPNLLHQLQALEAYDIDAIVRPQSDDPVLIKQILELGARSILIPVVESRQQAENIVKATRYPPEGIRGMGSIMGRSGRWGAIENYVQTANEHICIIAMIETKRGIDNINEILAVDGIDAVFFGPNDLSASLGVIDQVLNDKVIDAIKVGISAAKDAKKPSGVLTVNLEMMKEYADLGARILGIGIDTLILLNQSRNLLARAKGRISKLMPQK